MSRQFIIDLKYANRRLRILTTIEKKKRFTLLSDGSYFENLFNGVVNDEHDEENFTAENEVVKSFNVSNQFHGPKIGRGDDTTDSRKFEDQSTSNDQFLCLR